MFLSHIPASSIDMHDEAPTGCDWANLAKCASHRSALAGIVGDEARSAREAATAVSHYHNRYLLWPLR
jgi:hypothetical protein